MTDRAAWAAVSPRVVQLGLLLAALGTWEVVARSGAFSPILFPSLDAIGAALWKSAAKGELLYHLKITVLEILLAFVVGALFGLATGLVIGLRRLGREIFEPLVLLAYSIPMATLIPFFVVLLGLGVSSKVAFGAVYAFFPVTINTLAGITSVDRTHFALARSLSASPLQTFSRIVLPAAFPAVVSGLQGGMSLGIIGVVACEMFASQFGLGYLIDFAYTMLETPKVYGMVLVTLTVALVFNVGFRRVTAYVLRRAHHYQPSAEA